MTDKRLIDRLRKEQQDYSKEQEKIAEHKRMFFAGAHGYAEELAKDVINEWLNKAKFEEIAAAAVLIRGGERQKLYKYLENTLPNFTSSKNETITNAEKLWKEMDLEGSPQTGFFPYFCYATLDNELIKLSKHFPELSPKMEG